MPTSENYDLADLTSQLDGAIRQSVASLYDVQTASNNVHVGEAPHRQEFRSIRKLLQRAWQHIIQFLKESHAYGSDIRFLGTSASGEKLEDVAQFIEDMSDSTRRLANSASQLLEEQKALSGRFQAEKSAFDDCITGNQKSKSEWLPPKRQRGESAKAISPPSGSSNLYKEFYTNLHPDGMEMLNQFQQSLEDYQCCVLSFHRFWEGQSASCRRILELCRAKDVDALVREAGTNVSEWGGYQPAIMSAVAGISKSIDAITTDAPISRLGGTRVTSMATPPVSGNNRKNRRKKALILWQHFQRRLFHHKRTS